MDALFDPNFRHQNYVDSSDGYFDSEESEDESVGASPVQRVQAVPLLGTRRNRGSSSSPGDI